MARPSISTAEKLEIQLKKSLNRQRVDNIVLHPTYSCSRLPAKSTFLADVTDKTGCSIPFTESGFLPPQHDFVCYTDIKSMHWISKDLAGTMKGRRDKRDVYDWLELDLADGSTLVLKNLDKAVLPLLSFFQWLQREKK